MFDYLIDVCALRLHKDWMPMDDGIQWVSWRLLGISR